MIISKPNLFFSRFTPEQSQFTNMTDFSLYKKKIYNIINEGFILRKQSVDFQMVGIFETSRDGVLHFHFLFIVPMSENFLRDSLKKKLDAYGNKMISLKRYDCTQESFDTSCAYMSKGDPKTEFYQTTYKQFNFKGLDHYSEMYNNYDKKQHDNNPKAEKHKKYQFFLSLVHKNLEKTHKKSKLKSDTKFSIKDILSWYNYDDLRKFIFKTIVHHYIKEMVFFPFSQIAEMSVWLALKLTQDNGKCIDEEIQEIGEAKNEKYTKVKLI